MPSPWIASPVSPSVFFRDGAFDDVKQFQPDGIRPYDEGIIGDGLSGINDRKVRWSRSMAPFLDKSRKEADRERGYAILPGGVEVNVRSK